MDTRPKFSLILISLLCLTGLYLPRQAMGGEIISGLYYSANQYQNAKIKRVVSADTIILESGKRVHLIGLKAPEPPPQPQSQPNSEDKRDKFGFVVENNTPPSSPVRSIAERSLEFARNLLQGKHVRLEWGETTGRDNFVTQAYVFLPDGTFVNAEILRQGYANLSIEPQNMKYVGQLRKAYQQAWEEQRGLQGE